MSRRMTGARSAWRSLTSIPNRSTSSSGDGGGGGGGSSTGGGR